MIETAFGGRRIPAGLGRAVPWGLATLCAISLGWSAAPVIWRLTGEDGRVIPAPAATPGEPAARTDLEPLLAFAPFGQDTMPVPEPQATGETTLGLTLLGVTIGNPASASRAIISGGAVPIASYPVGARVTANADLAEVNAGHVVLRVDGRLETLSFPESSNVTAQAAENDPRSLIPQLVLSPSAPPPEASDIPTDIPEVAISRFRDAIQADARGFLDRLGVIPTGEGYRIADNASPDLLQAGIRPGDMITSVNGRQVGDIETDRSYIDEVASSGRARVELQRDGQAIVMSFPLR